MVGVYESKSGTSAENRDEQPLALGRRYSGSCLVFGRGHGAFDICVFADIE